MDWHGFTGFYVTLCGFVYIIYDLARTKQTALIAKERYRKGASDTGGEHYRHCLETARLQLAEVALHVNSKAGLPAAMRLDDLARNALHINALRQHVPRDKRKTRAEALSRGAGALRGVAKKNFDEILKTKLPGLVELLQILQNDLESELAPFLTRGEEDATYE